MRDGVTDAEVGRAVALIQSEFVTAMQAAGERADRLSLFATYFRDPARVNEQVDQYRAVTADQVNTFVRERLGEDNRASLLFIPREHGAGGANEEGAVEAGAEARA
jgi:predicted Zn-dependent peptidase